MFRVVVLAQLLLREVSIGREKVSPTGKFQCRRCMQVLISRMPHKSQGRRPLTSGAEGGPGEHDGCGEQKPRCHRVLKSRGTPA